MSNPLFFFSISGSDVFGQSNFNEITETLIDLGNNKVSIMAFVSENILYCFMFAMCKVSRNYENKRIRMEMIIEEEWLAITITSNRLGVYPYDSWACNYHFISGI